MEIMEIVQMKRRKSARPITHMITMIVADFFFEKNDETYWFQASDKVTQVLRYVRRTLAATSSIEDPVRQHRRSIEDPVRQHRRRTGRKRACDRPHLLAFRNFK